MDEEDEGYTRLDFNEFSTGLPQNSLRDARERSREGKRGKERIRNSGKVEGTNRDIPVDEY